MPFCPGCKVEYREGFTRCSDCNADLVAELPPEVEDTSAAPAGDELVAVFTSSATMEIEIVMEVLSSEGIRAVVRPPLSLTKWPVMMPDRLLQRTIFVPERRAEAARIALEQALEAGKYELRESE